MTRLLRALRVRSGTLDGSGDQPAWRRVAAMVVAVSLVVGVVGVMGALTMPSKASAAANPCGPPVTSVIACENTQPGDQPSDWQVTGDGDETIQGFATSMSVNLGQTVTFKIKTPSTAYHIDILRVGYYQGDGARKIAANVQPTATLPQTQPACLTDSSTGLVDCGNWAVSASWSVPTTAVSGLYLAHLVRNDVTGDQGSLIPFVVRNDASHSDVLYQTSDETWEAYNTYTDKAAPQQGNSLYQCNYACPPGNPGGYKAAYAVSYNRPFHSALDDAGQSWFMYGEYQMIRFMEKNGYDVSYTDGGTVDAQGALLLNHKVFMDSAHDEYWTGNQRANVQAARDKGVNLAFFSGNEVFWKTRLAPSQDGSNSPARTIVTYKETHFNAPTDPKDPPTWTGSWQDPRFSPPADGGQPQNALTGQLFEVNSNPTNGSTHEAITVPSQYSQLRFWRNTAVASLAAGGKVTLAPNTLGYEWDVDADDGFRPPGIMDMSKTTVSGVQAFVDYGTNTTNFTSTMTHDLTLYRAPSGALVFGAGTVQWAFGLDNTNPNSTPADVNMEQATVNLFADMGAQPATVTAGLVAATQSTDTTPPTSTVSSISTPQTDGTSVTVNGTATDAGGGVVAGVEISTDSGKTWHPATLGSAGAAQSTTWSYTWIAHGSPSTSIETRAVDDSGNLETPSDAQTVSVQCPCSIWGNAMTPTIKDSADPSSVEVGMKFTTDTFGTITGVRFYKSTANTGTHVGDLWTANGALLATATFTNETASGWEQVSFSSPVAVLPNTTYIVSYLAPKGHYADDQNYFFNPPNGGPDGSLDSDSMTDSAPLHAVRDTGTTTNGVYTYGGGFPSSDNGDGENFWVDPVFSPAGPPGTVTTVTATPGYQAANLNWTAPSTGGPPTSYTITPYSGSTALAPTTVSGSPAPTSAVVGGLSDGTPYTFTVTANNPSGSGPPSSPSAPVTPTLIPTFQQGSSSHAANVAKVQTTPPKKVTSPDRLIVAVGTWGSTGAKTSAVTDSAGNTFTEVSKTTAPDNTEMSVWTAPITNVGTGLDTITAQASATADMAVSAAEYSDLSYALGTAAVDQVAANSGTTGSSAATVSSGATPAVSANNSLAMGFYADSGFGNTLTGATGYTVRNSVFPTNDMELLTEDQTVNQGATPSASVGTGKATPWAMATVVFKGGGAPTAPATPTAVTASPLPAAASVNWTAPSNNGSPITSYVITPYLGGVAQPTTTVYAPTGSQPATTGTVNNLQNGQAYTFTVSAVNALGTGPESAASAAITPSAPSAPGAPTNVVATAGDASANLSWTAPSDGGSAITSYKVTTYLTDESTTAQGSYTIAAPATSTTISPLTNGQQYNFTVTAVNGVGTGPASSQSNAVTPNTPPGTPTSVSATPGNQSATVSWTPATTGGTASSYTVTPYAGSTAQAPTQVPGSSTTAAVAGLTNGTAYTFTVTASNSGGSSPASTPSAAVTPFAPGPPGAPSGVTASAGNGTATVNWTAPPNNGSNLTSYTVTPYVGTTAQNSLVVNGLNGAPPATTATFNNLANGTSYTFTVTATNGLGTGPTSAASAPVTPVGQPPAPANVVAVAGRGSVSLSWTMASNGGSPITGYTVTPYVGSTAQAPVSVPGAEGGGSSTLDGLTNGVTYTFTVTAANAVSSGPSSVPSNPATPSATSPNCPCSLLGSATPQFVDTGDPSAVEVGVQFTSDTTGYITGIRFYKASTNTGTHSGHIWTASGQLLGSVTFTGETASGWQQANFVTAIPVTAGTTYVASYFAPNGHYSVTNGGFATGVNSPPLYALANSTTPNGVYAYGSTSSFPPNSYNATNYWVDPVFNVSPLSVPAAPGNVVASAGSGSATVSWTPAANGGSAITGYTITPYVGATAQATTPAAGTATSVTVPNLTNGTKYTFTVSATNSTGTGPPSAQSNAITAGALPPTAPTNVVAAAGNGSATVSWSAPSTNNGSAITGYTITPYVGSTPQSSTSASSSALSATIPNLSNGTTYTFVVTATNGNGTSPLSAPSNRATPSTGVNCPCTIFASTTPQAADSGDAGSVEVGAKFNSDTNGYITGVRFYKATTNTGTHVGHLWSSTGQLLATATFSGETASGWQTASFPTAVAITAGTTYVISYYAPNGHYATTPNGFGAAGVDNPPLYALANGTTPDGVYAYGSGGTFPASTYNATNYWVDPVMSTSPPSAPGAPSGVGATAGNATAAVTWTAPSNGGSPITSYTITPYIGSTPQPATTAPGSATSATVGNLSNGATYTFMVSATNNIGTGPASAPSAAVTPVGPPAAPTNVVGAAGNGSATVSWAAAAGGGASVTNYTITPYVGSTAQGTTQAAGNATSATVTGLTNGTTYTFVVTATNGNGTGPASAPSNLVTPSTGPNCPCTVFASATPKTVDSGDGSAVQLGVKFNADTAGYITGLRFYKSTANTGTHTANLWTAAGQLLATATFTNETGSGWQQVNFSTPVAVTPGTTYVASYYAPNGHYSGDSGALSTGASNPPLYAVPNTTSQNGVYVYGSATTFPSNSFNAANYWVDPVFNLAPPGVPAAPTGVTATAGNSSATVSWTAPSSGGSAITGYTITQYAGATAQATIPEPASATSATVGGLTNGTSYTFTVTANNAIGAGPASAPSVAVTPEPPPAAPTGVVATSGNGSATVSWTAPANNGSPITGYTITPYVASAAQAPTSATASATSATVTGLANGTTYTFVVTALDGTVAGPGSAPSNPATPSTGTNCQCTIFGTSTPSTPDSGDSASVEVGVKFTSDTNGYINGVRFYKASTNTGTHIGNLWTASGQLLASVTFTNETASGWQEGDFSAPVAVTAGTTYVASYFAPTGHYSATPGAFANGAVNSPPLYALANSTNPNGVYTYGSGSNFPTTSYNATNYWVDAVFSTTGPAPSAPPAPTRATAATAGSGAVTVSWAPSGGSGITSYTVTPYIGSTAQAPQPVTGSPLATSTTLTGLTNGATYTFVVSATNSVGTSPASTPSNPATPNAGLNCPCSLHGASTPGNVDSGDASPIELGLKFTSDTTGHVTGVRFYKSAANTGTHVGNLWTTNGRLLATVTFTNETASGWQQANFSTPVAITAGTTYVVSYFAPNGHYSGDPNALSSGLSKPPLYAVANSNSPNGVYAYGGTSSFPTSSYGAADYWVDPVFGP